MSETDDSTRLRRHSPGRGSPPSDSDAPGSLFFPIPGFPKHSRDPLFWQTVSGSVCSSPAVPRRRTNLVWTGVGRFILPGISFYSGLGTTVLRTWVGLDIVGKVFCGRVHPNFTRPTNRMCLCKLSSIAKLCKYTLSFVPVFRLPRYSLPQSLSIFGNYFRTVKNPLSTKGYVSLTSSFDLLPRSCLLPNW